MQEQTREVLRRFEIRKTNTQKAAFRAWLCETLADAGYAPKVETKKGIFTSNNVVLGDPETAKILLTAHYDTCPVLPLPNFITPRNLFFYLVYQLFLCLPVFAAVIGMEVLIILVLDAPPLLAVAAAYAILIFFIWWMLDGKANRHTANDNTSGVMTVLELALTLPEEQRKNVCIVFFDNEERGLLGSSAFAKEHPKAKKNALVLNFDCVSDGDYIQLYPSRAVKKDGDTLRALDAAFVGSGKKTCETVKGFGFYPSDQAGFRRGVGICALKKSPVLGYYMDRIHTVRDTVMEEENIGVLRESVLHLIANEAKEPDYAG